MTIEDYKKLSDALEKMYDLLYQTNLVTYEVIKKADQIYNEAEILILDEK